MNQPRFKFGDKVNVKGGAPFIIGAIYVDGTVYRYSHSETALFAYQESKLELYQEPKKKKLYAFKCRDTKWVGLTDEPLLARDNNFDRAPEYDLEYSSEEVK